MIDNKTRLPMDILSRLSIIWQPGFIFNLVRDDEEKETHPVRPQIIIGA